MHMRRAGHVVARPLNCGVRRHVKLIDLLGRQLKDDAVVGLLELYELQVVYEFDRLHENTPDYYTVQALTRGFELRFNEAQILDTVFCYITSRDGFEPIEADFVGVPMYESIGTAAAAAQRLAVKVTRKDGVKFLGRVTSWIRLEHKRQSWHFEYSNDALARVTLIHRD
jgi:hypothetical protein